MRSFGRFKVIDKVLLYIIGCEEPQKIAAYTLQHSAFAQSCTSNANIFSLLLHAQLRCELEFECSN